MRAGTAGDQPPKGVSSLSESRVSATTAPTGSAVNMRAGVTRIAIVGHRELGGAATVAFVATASRSVLGEALRGGSGVTAVSALAEGADTIFAEAAVALGIPLHVVTPFSGYESDFAGPQSRARYRRLRAAAESERALPNTRRSRSAYRAAMRWLVDTCDLLVAAWDGRPGLGPGGTADAVEHALSTERSVLHLDVVRHVVGPLGTRP